MEINEDVQLKDEKFSVDCRQIFIGSHHFEPKLNEVVFSWINGSFQIQIVVPSVAGENKDRMMIVLDDEMVAKFVVHFSTRLAIIFVYGTPKAGEYIRPAIGMSEEQEPNSPFFDPAARFHPQIKRIVLILRESASKNWKKSLLLKLSSNENKFDVISANDAKMMYKECCLDNEDFQLDLIQIDDEIDGSKNLVNSTTGLILIYPPGPGGISIHLADYRTLNYETELNDIIVDFYLQYIVQEIIEQELRERIHLFSTHFYKRLTAIQTQSVQGSRSEHRHDGVKKWTKNVNIFEKDFNIIPLNTGSHWFVAIVCWIWMDKPNSDMRGMKQPCILIFDSNAGRLRTGEIRMIREYLEWEYWAKFRKDIHFNSKRLPAHSVKVPHQENYTDCGLFLLEFVERFLIDRPIKNYEIPIKGLENWFSINVATEKRRQIAELIQNLMKKYGFVAQLPEMFQEMGELQRLFGY